MSVSSRLVRRAVGCFVLLVAAACGSSPRQFGTTPLPSHATSTSPSPSTSTSTGTVAAGSPWPEAMRDGRHSGTSTAVGPRTGTVRWRRDLGGNATPGPVIGSDGSIVTATNNGVLYALDPADGTTRWSYDAASSYGNDLSTSPAVLGDGTIVWPGPAGMLYGIDSHGALEWKIDLGGFVLSPAIAPSGRIFAATMSGTLSAIDVTANHATVAWQVETGAGSYASPSVGPGGTIVTASSNEVVAITDNGTSASVKWRYPIAEQIEVSPAIGPDGTVVVGTNGRLQYGLDAAKGTPRWTVPRGDETYSSAVVTPAGLAYYGDHTATLYVVDVRTGKVVRSTMTAAPTSGRSLGIWTAPAIDAEGAAFYGTRSGHVFGVGPSGAVLFDLDIGGTVDSYPAIGGDGTLYIGSSTGVLTAVAAG